MMEIGTRIKMFPETDVISYEEMLRDKGYKCKQAGEYIIIVGYRRMAINREKFGYLLKTERIKKGFDKKTFSDMIKVSKASLLRWERGERLPNEYNLTNICDVLGVNRDFFEV